MNFEKWGGRRYVLVWGVYVGSSVLLCLSMLDAANYALLLGFSVGAYISGNTAQKIKAPT